MDKNYNGFLGDEKECASVPYYVVESIIAVHKRQTIQLAIINLITVAVLIFGFAYIWTSYDYASTETTTETPAETEETTTTTTATETETTTTTEAAEETETATETEAPAEKPEETGIVTYPDNDEGLYPMPECFRRKVEECSGNSVVSVDYDTVYNTYYASVDDGRKYIYYIGKIDNYESEIITDLEDYILSDSTVPEYDGIIVYAPKE